MRYAKLSMFLAVFAVASIGACDEDPSIATEPDASASLVASGIEHGGSPPILLEVTEQHPDYPDPYMTGCAQAVSNEGVLSGWFFVEGFGYVARWDGAGKLLAVGIIQYPWVRDMNNKGQVLVERGGTDPEFDQGWLLAWNPDGSFTHTLGAGDVDLAQPLRITRTGNVIGTYDRARSFDEPPYPPRYYVLSSEFGPLTPPDDPARVTDPSFVLPGAECWSEAVDPLGRMYGVCSINGRRVHYRWTRGTDPVRLPGAEPAHLADVRILDVNRYGEVVGSSPAGPVYWSRATGRIQIPAPPDNRFPAALSINDRGVVLLSGGGYWTRTGGTRLLRRGGWPGIQVYDINNHGLIAGCVSGDGGRLEQPAYWRID